MKSNEKQRRVKQPKSPAEWQEAADIAEALIGLESARMYGLITGGPEVNVERCEEILRQAKGRGIKPTREGVDRVIRSLA